jgi:uncharacterized protein YecE (DUF72 family)
MAFVKIGVSAWTEKTLIDSGWYPPGTHDAASRLRYYASQFPLVEVDATHYAIPSRHTASVWVARTPAGFTLNVKAHALMTEHYTEPARLPQDLFAALPPAVRDKPRVYPRDVGDDVVRELARRFTDAIQPLAAAGRLGVVLFQFPVWFPRTRQNLALLARTRFLVPGCRVAIELRNHTWFAPGRYADTLDFLRDHGLAYTCVDEPQGFASSVPPIAAATSDVALVRFHGRAAHLWHAGAPSAADRFAYLYPRAELADWVPRIQRLAREAAVDEVQVIMNNCHRDFAVRNAADLRTMLAEQAVAAHPA